MSFISHTDSFFLRFPFACGFGIDWLIQWSFWEFFSLSIFSCFFLMSFRDDLLTMSTATDLAIAFFLGRPREASDQWNSAHRVQWVAY